MTDKIKFPVGDGKYISVEKSTNPLFPREIYVGIEDDNDVWVQDLVVVHQDYTIDDAGVRYIPKKIKILVYGDVTTTDYTQEVKVDVYEEDEDED